MPVKKSNPKPAPAKKQPQTVDAYLAALPPDVRAAMQKVRVAIRAAAPNATERIAYQVPVYSLHGDLVAIAAFKNHCSLVTMSMPVMNALRSDIAPFDTKGSAIHFTAKKPLTAALVKKIMRARIAENEAAGANKAKRRA